MSRWRSDPRQQDRQDRNRHFAASTASSTTPASCDMIFHKMSVGVRGRHQGAFDGLVLRQPCRRAHLPESRERLLRALHIDLGLIGNFGQANWPQRSSASSACQSIALDMGRFNVRPNCVRCSPGPA